MTEPWLDQALMDSAYRSKDYIDSPHIMLENEVQLDIWKNGRIYLFTYMTDMEAN